MMSNPPDRGGGERPSGELVRAGEARVAGYIAEELLVSLREAGLLSSPDALTDGTAAYLAGRLAELARPEGLVRYERWASNYEVDIACRVTKEMGRHSRLLLYQTNADYTLVSLGLFDRPLVGRAGRGQGLDHKRKDLERRGIHLYLAACAQAEAVFGREGDLPRIFGTLSAHFPRYCGALRTLGAERWDIVARLSEGALFHLQQAAHGADGPGPAGERWDEFLDAFASWRRSGTDEARSRMLRAAKNLAAVDPRFGREGFDEGRWNSGPPEVDDMVRE